MTEALEVAGVRDISGKSILLTEQEVTVHVQVGSTERDLSAAQCRLLARQLQRFARRLDARDDAGKAVS